VDANNKHIVTMGIKMSTLENVADKVFLIDALGHIIERLKKDVSKTTLKIVPDNDVQEVISRMLEYDGDDRKQVIKDILGVLNGR